MNPAAVRLLGVSSSELLGRRIDETFPRLRERGLPAVFAATALGEGAVEVDDFTYGDDQIRTATWAFKAFPLPEGRVGVVFDDVTERKRTETALREAKELLEAKVAERTAELTRWVGELERRTGEITLLSEMGDLLQACATTDEANVIVGAFCSQLFPGTAGAVYLLGPSRSHLERVTGWGEVRAFDQTFAPADCWALRRGRPYLNRGGAVGPPCSHVRRERESSLCVPLMAQGEALGVLHLVAPDGELGVAVERMARTIAEQVALSMSNLRLRQTLRDQAIRDPLTGLFNRRFFEESLERELHRASRTGLGLSLLMIDIDHFKRFNDTFGHQAGDALLRELASLIKTRVRAADVACRYGGEEFVILLPDAGLEDARGRAESLRDSARRLSVSHSGQLLGQITISVGVASFPTHGADATSLLREADDALYRAKAEGRDRVVTATRDFETERG